MQISFCKNVVNTDNKKQVLRDNKALSASPIDKDSMLLTQKPLSFLEIPKEAFSSNFIKKQKDVSSKAITESNNIAKRFNLLAYTKPDLSFSQVFVNPQDPLITKAELMTISSKEKIEKGPKNSRVAIRDMFFKPAEPNTAGNFIFPENSPQFDQVNSFTLVNSTLNMYEKLMDRKINWAFSGDVLTVDPHAGVDTNAFYDRQSKGINLFFFKRPDTGKVVQTSEQSDVICHETGHAVLDGLKPELLEAFGFAGRAFHEAFGDTTAMLMALQSDSLINKMLDMTDGDIRKENVISKLAEEFGDAINKNDDDPSNDNMQYLRNAINFFKQKPIKEMPYIDRENDDTVLGLECHSYGRLYIGAVYDILAGLYEKSMEKLPKSRDNQKFAIIKARDVLSKNFARALDFSPAAEVNFSDLAKALIKADIFDNAGKNRKVIEDVFKDRKILTDEDIKKLDEEMTNLPQLTLPENIVTKKDIKTFVDQNSEALGLPSDAKFYPQEAYINGKGEKHIVLLYQKPIILNGKQYGEFEGQSAPVNGSLCLTFDQDRKLIDKTVKLVDKELEDEILYSIQLLIENGAVGEAEEDSILGKLKKLGDLDILSVKSDTTNETELARKNIISDPQDYSKIGRKAMAEYFQKLQQQMNVSK